MELYSIKDIKAGTFGNPLPFVNRAVAIRSLAEAAAQPDTMLSKHGYDYQLFFLGEIDAVSGVISCPPQPDFVITVGELLPPVRAAA